MIDFEIMERSLKIAWIKRIAESSNASWKKIPNQALNQYGGIQGVSKVRSDLFCFNVPFHSISFDHSNHQ